MTLEVVKSGLVSCKGRTGISEKFLSLQHVRWVEKGETMEEKTNRRF